MKIVVAIEGVDGSGKSSLAQFIYRLSQEHGLGCTLVGRGAGTITPAIAKMTQVLREEVRNLSAEADLFLRIAREYQRAHVVASTPEGIVLLDRFVLTVLSLARVYDQKVETLTLFLREIVSRADLFATIHVDCPFELAWSRVERRRPGSSHRQRGEAMLRRVAEFMAEDFQRGLLTGQQWPVDNSRSLEEAQEQVAGYLTPYFQVQSV